MAQTQKISFTALPSGVAPSTKLRLSVFIAPRLWTDDGPDAKVNLSQFGDWVDWPKTQQDVGLQFQLLFDVPNATPLAATLVGDPPSSDLWKKLFGGTTYLRPRTFEQTLSQASVSSYSVKDVHAKLKDIYTHVAANFPTEFPSVGQLIGTNGPLTDVASLFILKQSVPAAAKGPVLAALAPKPLAALTPAQHLSSVQSFHSPFKITKSPISVPDVDFHQMLSALGRYPALMRALGLVRDLELTYPGNLGNTRVRVIPSWPTGPDEPPKVWTRCFVGPGAFYARPRETGPELSSDGLGMLAFDDGNTYEIIQVNQDGAAIKTLRFAESVVHATYDPSDNTVPIYQDATNKTVKIYKTVDTPTNYSIPALMSAGIAVARNEREKLAMDNLKASATKNSQLEAAEVELDAEDVTRGYAIDVWDDISHTWHSLCERVGTYKFAGTTLSNIADEGWIGMGLTSIADKSNTNSKLPQTLFNWFGWSLSAPRPGKTMDKNGQPIAVQNTPATQFDLSVDFVAKPGSLPRLRFGTSYRLRARAVDLAGNRTRREAVTGFDHATPAIAYGRFEPVASPEVVLDDALAEGDARDRIVVRSNYNTATQAPAIRHIAPPKAAEPMSETLGTFDASSGVVDPDAYKLLQKLDGGSWIDIGTPDPNNPGVFYVKEQGNILPYLPDLLSRGAVLRELPGAATPMKVPFDAGQPWPDLRPFDLVLQEGSGSPQYDPGPRRLVVFLGKADVVKVRLSSYMDQLKGDVDRMALLRWMEETMPAGTVATFRQQVADGIHWMVTPFRTLTLVHAVRQPLLRPKFIQLLQDRMLAQTFAPLTANVEVSRKSTSRIDVVARWTETIDATKNPGGPIVAQGSARPLQVKVEPPQGTTMTFQGNHEFGDTKYRHVIYSMHATSRFAEYFAERKSKMQVHSGQAVLLHAPVTDDGVDWGGVVDGSETVTAADRTTKYVRGTDYKMNYAAGTLTPFASLDGKTVNITFIAPPIVRRTAEETPLDIPSSARPAAPKVLYLIPTFGWTRSENQEGTLYKSERSGGGLRAYIERPWFSSGDGELLGVVIWSNGIPTDDAKPFVSDWGLDPMYKSAATPSVPTVAAFKRATTNKTSGLTLEELGTVNTLHVAGHPVGYDAERQLWYCDLEIDAGPSSYMPFVRLAFARFQPNSVDNAHLSRVQLADFVQLTANRSASLTRASKQSDTLNVAVTGLSYKLLQSAAGPSTVEVSVEQRRDTNASGDVVDELGWDQVPGPAVALTPAAGPNGTTIWSGQITLPKAPPGRLRVIIREFERFGPTAADRRLVYADAVAV